MKNYLDLLRHIKENGIDDEERTGTGARSVFGYQMRFNLQDGFPLLTTKKMHLKSIIHELLWFLKGDTNIKYLKDNGVTIWDEWANQDGSLGPVYGQQWSAWEGVAHDISGQFLYQQEQPLGYGIKTIDQITWAINRLKTNPQCRRIIVSAWNVADIPRMKLAPCHCLFQFYTAPLNISERQAIANKSNLLSGGNYMDKVACAAWLDANNIPKRKLSCQLYQRSCDVPLGVGYNVASYALLTMMFAQCVNMVPHEFIWTGGNCHVYANQWDGVNEQLTREPYQLPTMRINTTVKDILSFSYNDFKLDNYQCHPAIKMPVAV